MSPFEDEKLDPRVKRTRQMIEQAFDDLIKEKGFQTLSVQDITERAGINRATFYAHFPDKYALLDHSIRHRFHQELEKRMLNVCQFSLGNLRNLVIVVCEFVDKSHSQCAHSDLQFQALVEVQVRIQIHGLIGHWLEGLPSGVDFPATRASASTAASWALYGLAVEWNRTRRMPPLEEYADQVLPLLAANLGLNMEAAAPLPA